MNIVVCHNNMDFDSLASAYAVTRLYPSTRMVLGYPLVGNVRQFLSLYRDSLPIAQLRYINLSQVEHIFIVDCQHAERFDDLLRRYLIDSRGVGIYTIFDHHLFDPCGLGPGAATDSIIRASGACTTLLVEQIRKLKLKLTPFEATLLALGIYEDSGCLTYRGATAADARCIAFLLERGADLSTVTDFLNPKLSDEQVKLLEQLVGNCRSVNVSGAKVVLAQGEWPRYLEGLATLTRKLLEVESAAAVLTVVRMRDRVHVVGRSDTPAVDVRQVVRELGGDGHPGAAAAVLKGARVQEVVLRVEAALASHVEPEKQAADIMTAPVRTIHPRKTMEEAQRIMLRYGQDGLVVTESDSVVGVVSRRDIDQARHHRLSHAPVQGFMSHPVITISPQTPLSKIQQIMIKEDIGRLPVLDADGQLVGLVSRTEVLQTLYGQSPGAGGEEQAILPERHYPEFKERLARLDGPTRWLFEQVGIAAARLNMTAYAVGGCVRDLLLGRRHFDLDFVVEGSALDLGSALESMFPARLHLIARHERFQTATLEFYCPGKRQVDLSTAREEFYEYPAALPTVEASILRQDLYRRDFTINALAICLNPGCYGDLVDYFGGLNDLEAKKLRTLHPFSFIEDPTRIVRAARFASRLGLTMDERTRQQALRAIEMGIFDDLGGVRIREEVRLILESPDRLEALDLLGKLGGRLGYLDAQLGYDRSVAMLLRRAERLLAHYRVAGNWVVYLALLIARLDEKRRQAVLNRLHLSSDEKEQITRGFQLPGKLAGTGAKLKASEIYHLLQGVPDQALAIAACLASPGSPSRRMIKVFLEELKSVAVSVKGADLIRLGVPEGPEIGKLLSKVTDARLDSVVSTLDEELSYVKKLLSDGDGGQ